MKEPEHFSQKLEVVLALYGCKSALDARVLWNFLLTDCGANQLQFAQSRSSYACSITACVIFSCTPHALA